MSQRFVAADEVQLDGGRVVLQRQQTLPHDGVFLFERKEVCQNGASCCLEQRSRGAAEAFGPTVSSCTMLTGWDILLSGFAGRSPP